MEELPDSLKQAVEKFLGGVEGSAMNLGKLLFHLEIRPYFLEKGLGRIANNIKAAAF